ITFEFGEDITAAANEDQSVTRNPDGNTQDADRWAQHSTVSADLFSPGLSLTGNPTYPKPLPPLTIVINEVLADPPSGAAGDANGDGTRSSSEDEFVELANVGEAPVDIGGWMLGDDEGVGFTFPEGYTVQPRDFVVVFGGGDITNAPGYDPDPMMTKVFSADSTIGNGIANGGEIVLLLSDDGTYDTWLAYGSKANTGGPPDAESYEIGIDVGAPANADNSITRFPDGNINVLDPFVQHLTVSNASFSPAMTVDGRDRVPPPQPPITVVINEVLADAVGDANGDGTTDASEDQFIEIVNTSEELAVDLSGWSVGDGSSTTFEFPNGYTIAPQAMVAVFGGGDVSNAPGYNADPMMSRAFAASGALGDGLDPAGDYAVLLSDDGSYDSYVAFGTANGAGDPDVTGSEMEEYEFALGTVASAANATSITRDPDGNFLAADPFVEHAMVSEAAWSPAQTTDGVDALDDFIDVAHPWGTGHALHFTWWERDRVEIRDAPLLMPLRMDQGTIEMWFRPDSVLTNDTHDPDWTYLFGKNFGGNQEGDLGLAWRRGEGRLLFFMQDGTNTTNLEQNDRVDDVFYPRWYHVAVTWNTAGNMRIFLDGKLQSEVASEVPLLGGEQQIAIGNGAADLWNQRFEGFRGMIDEVRFSVIERYTEDFDLPTAPYESDEFTLALWHFDEGTGDEAADASGNGFTGTLGGFDINDEPDPASAPAWVDITTIVNTESTELPERFTLDQNYPNPFNPVTTIGYNVPRHADVRIDVYNVLGQRVSTLMDREHTPGDYAVTFDGRRLASGMYFYILQTNDTHIVKKMVLLK
ncbi:MAG: T9SS type A sorting domain-containing protein, partial [Rhodothermales bacterium]|nr:T9SS type A sorting domain-containing protein [Rhodothermales bacterium]